ncbi:uncharacterized protein LOC108675840 [Hyalella azteca]|uniref:Uncharacterized protein LOC108675840 n=1 Tax=Hyalella azteca TaxID=294128 RepID=A0A8B7NZV7_HYAAZ|nr:uncharacterized protein LOC108675840 [Hyalella azteca]
MASATIECDVCNEKFDSGNHKPLRLTCDHTFCFSCITNLLKLPGTKNCPKCGKQVSQQIDQILVNYALIPSENTARPHAPSSLSEAPCLHHGKALDYLCVDCMELVCFTCTRGTHVTHKIVVIDDQLKEDESVLNSWAKIRATIDDNLGRVNNLVSVSDDILSFIDEMKIKCQEWKNSLLVQKLSTEQDLKAWDVTVTGANENWRHECKEILCRLKLKHAENMETFEIRARLSAALEKLDSLQIQEPPVTATARHCAGAGAAVLRVQNDLQATPPQGATTGATSRTFQVPGPTYELPTYEHGVHWTVTSRDEGERAVASLSNNIKPSRLVVLSTHTRPIPGLRELLSRLAAHHTGDISLLPLDYFWRPKRQSDGGMAAILKKFRDRLDTLYGSPGQVRASLNRRRRVGMQIGNCKIGVRFDSNSCTWEDDFPDKIDDACCVRGATSDDYFPYGFYNCRVTRWHFPDLYDEDLDWIIPILSNFENSRLSLVLPRNGLTATGARVLFHNLPQIREVYHDPGAAHLTSAGSRGAPNRTFIELSTNNIMQWM